MQVKAGRFLWFFVFLLVVTGAFGQAKGAIFDEEAYSNLPRAASLSSRSYEGLPASFSLKQYAPLPGDQSGYNTCVAWAAAYAARTISESVALNRKNQTETTGNVFSPVHIYKNISPDDPECAYGTQIYRALDMMKETGAVRMVDIERIMSFRMVDLSNYKNSKNYPIGDYITLFSRDDRRKPALITRIVKKSLTEGKPVIIGMNTPDSFTDAKIVWEPKESPDTYYYGHAMCVVGYDDNRYGGSFEVMNSWGRKWGNGGYIWIPYRTFADFVKEGYEIIENISNYNDTIKFEGFFKMEILGEDRGDGAAFAEFNFEGNGLYRAAEIFKGGTNCRFVIGTGENAYVYAFTVFQDEDKFFSPVLLFPQTGISSLLNYNDVILPAEDKMFTMNTQNGSEYVVLLYSKQALDINGIMRRFESANGAVYKRLVAAVDNLTTDLSFNKDTAAFSVMPDNARTVAAMIMAIQHH
jgi:hypothetical protein